MTTHEVWRKETDIKDNGKLIGRVVRRVKVNVADDGTPTVAMENYTTGPRGGFHPHGFPGFTLAEWNEIQTAVRTLVLA